MPLWVPFNEWGWKLHSHDVRPAGTQGASITPGNNVMGSYAQIISGANVVEDVWALEVIFQAGATATAKRDILATIGIDPAGGTSYTDTINHLLASEAASFVSGTGWGISYYFPLFIKAGSSIGCKAQVNNATVGTIRAMVKLYGRPSRPELIKTGSFVRTYGANTAASNGTVITPGTTSQGAWTQLGTLSDNVWFWQLGYGTDDATMANLLYGGGISVGDATNKKIIIDQHLHSTGVNETSHYSQPAESQCYGYGKSGELVYGRLWCSGAADTIKSMIAYAVGG